MIHVAHFDGACMPRNPGGYGGWGFVIYDVSDPSTELATGCGLLAPVSHEQFVYRNTNRYRPDQAEFVHEMCSGWAGQPKSGAKPRKPTAQTAVPARYLVACVDGVTGILPHLRVHPAACALSERHGSFRHPRRLDDQLIAHNRGLHQRQTREFALRNEQGRVASIVLDDHPAAVMQRAARIELHGGVRYSGTRLDRVGVQRGDADGVLVGHRAPLCDG
jgi:hypothetical protein